MEADLQDGVVIQYDNSTCLLLLYPRIQLNYFSQSSTVSINLPRVFVETQHSGTQELLGKTGKERERERERDSKLP